MMNEFEIIRKLEELLDGAYGKETAQEVQALPLDKQLLVARSLVLQQAGESILNYGRTLRALLGQGMLYQDRYTKGRYLFYAGGSQNVEKLSVIRLVNRLFLPWEESVTVYWEEPFTVLGEEACVRLGAIRL